MCYFVIIIKIQQDFIFYQKQIDFEFFKKIKQYGKQHKWYG